MHTCGRAAKDVSLRRAVVDGRRALASDDLPHRLERVPRQRRDGTTELPIVQQVQQRAQERAVVVDARDHEIVAFVEERDEAEREGFGRCADAEAAGRAPEATAAATARCVYSSCS